MAVEEVGFATHMSSANHSYLQLLSDLSVGNILAKKTSALDEFFRGCLLGLSLGDAIGAPYEGGLVERFIWRLIGKTRKGCLRWTDDTQMAMDVAESVIQYNGVNQDDLASRFARSYQWSRGYGPSTAKILKKMRKGVSWRQLNKSVFPNGSYGNGAAMRAPVIGLFFCNSPIASLQEATEQSAVITHAHPIAIEGAKIIALTTALAVRKKSSNLILEVLLRNITEKHFRKQIFSAKDWLTHTTLHEPQEVHRQLGNGIAANESCITAFYIALRFIKRPFDEMMAFAIQCGGDTDTIGSMAGAIWGAYNGEMALPSKSLHGLEDASKIREIAVRLAARVKAHRSHRKKYLHS